MCHSLLDACEFIHVQQGEPQSGDWLASQIMEMKLWRASEASVRATLIRDIRRQGNASRFTKVAEDEVTLREWMKEKQIQKRRPFIAIQ